MDGTLSRMLAGVAGGAMIGCVTLLTAPTASADHLSYCGSEHELSPQVSGITTSLQTAVSSKGWQWTDPDVRAATGAILDGYPKLNGWVNTLATTNANAGAFGLWVGPVVSGDYNGDARKLQGAMDALQANVRDANNPAGVLPGTQAVMTALRGLDSDCIGHV